MSCQVCLLPLSDTALRPSNNRQCPFCLLVFSRVDGAKRHARSCPQRQGRTLQAGRRGRKSKSCDQCVRIKVHCNAGDRHPCDRCRSRGQECTLARFCTDTKHRRVGLERAIDSGHRENRGNLSFLLNVTDENQDFVTEKALGDEPDGVLVGPTHEAASSTPSFQSQSWAYGMFDCINPTLLFQDQPEPSLESMSSISGEQDLLGALLYPQSIEDRLSARLGLLELDVATHGGSADNTSVVFDREVFLCFFSVSKVQRFANNFCRKRHYQYPIIHWPTFALEESSLPLLMVVALTGAAYSYSSDRGSQDVTDSRRFYPLADSYISHQLAVFLDRTTADADVKEGIELCQAALLMYALATFLSNSSAMRRRAVTERLPILINAMRRLGFVGCRHEISESWQQFLTREHMIRLASWIYGTDCLVTFSYNQPPNFSLMEMSGDLPCDPEVWDADSVGFDALNSARPTSSLSLKDLVSRLLDATNQADNDWEGLPFFHIHLTILDLGVLTKAIVAFQHLIYNMHVSMCLELQATSILRALEAWRDTWGRATDKMSATERKLLGVAKNLPHIEHITRRIVEVTVSPERDRSKYLHRIPSHSAADLNEFIRDFVLPR